jgi:hypothetical protein
MSNITAGEAAWKMAFQISPIIMAGGIASLMPMGYLPLIAVTELINFPAGLLSGMHAGLDSVFANFRPLAGASALQVEIAHYPLPNRQIAGNSMVFQPLQVSLEMICPAQTKFGYWEKLAVFTALQTTLELHLKLGGTFIVMTPNIIYNNCLLRSVRDVTGAARTQQPQIAWQFDFERPLVTESDITGMFNSLIDWIGRQVEPATGAAGQLSATGVGASVASPSSIASPAAVPVAGQAAPGSSVISAPVGTGSFPGVGAQ